MKNMAIQRGRHDCWYKFTFHWNQEKKRILFYKEGLDENVQVYLLQLTPLRHKNDYFYTKQRHSPMNLYLNRVIIQTIFT